MFGLTRNYWAVSAAALLHNVRCTTVGIKHCKGRCCDAAIFWPAKSNPDPNTTACALLGAQGCTLGLEQRPVTCLLYPLVVKGQRLVIHHRSRFKGVSCYPNLRQCDMPLVELFKPALVHLFGASQYQTILMCARQGRDALLLVPDHIYAAHCRELQWENKNQIPKPREAL